MSQNRKTNTELLDENKHLRAQVAQLEDRLDHLSEHGAAAVALQQAGGIRQRRAVKEPHVYVRSEYIDVAESRVSQTGYRTAIMHKLLDFVAALSHHRKPLMRDGSQFTGMFYHPSIDGWIPLDSAVESEKF